jgi:potassium-dependent mechanosensitive channel
MTESNLKKMNVVKSNNYLPILFFSFVVCFSQADAQLDKLLKPNASPAKTSQQPKVDIESQLKIWSEEVAKELSRLDGYANPEQLPKGITETDIGAMRRTLEQTQLSIQRHTISLKDIADNKAALEAAQTESAEWKGYEEDAPKSILLVDELLNRKQALEEKLSSTRSSLNIFESTLNKWLGESTAVEEKVTAASLAFQKNDDGVAAWNLDFERAKQRAFFIRASALQYSISALKQSIAAQDVERNLIEKKIHEANRGAVFSDEDFERIKNATQNRKKSLREEIDELRKRQRKASTDEAAALANLNKIRGDQTSEAASIELAAINHEAAQARTSSLQMMIDSLEAFDQVETLIPEAYEYRKILLNSKTSSKERNEALESLSSLQQRISAWKIVSDNELASITADINKEQSRVTAFAADDPRLSAVKRIRSILWERQSLIQRLTQSLSVQLNMLDRWIEEYSEKYRQPWYSTLSNSLSGAWDGVIRIWNITVSEYEVIYERDGQKIPQLRQVTLGTIITALILFIIAYLIAAHISRRFQHLLVRRKIIGENQARTLRTWLMLLVALMLALATLNWLNIPLTIFAFLAGALAIGVGFGTQTIIKNFISGIILLFERKIRVGDVIEVDNTVGVVSEINTRSSIVRSVNGIENLVPNSMFLENRVVNWTLNNRNLRREIYLGVAYGSPTQDVLKILLEVADRHGLVLKDPEPIATFSNFGENSLDFTLYFWIELNDKTNRLVIESDLRIMIEKRLNEAGIGVPFPQRDIHLEMSKPLQVQMHPAEISRKDS